MTAAVDIYFQVWLAFTGVLALVLALHGNPTGRLFAPWIGLAGQPAWIYVALHTHQIGVLLVTLAYTGVWISGCVRSLRTTARKP